MPTVTRIQVQKRKADRFNIDLDGKYNFSISGLDLSQSGLREGLELSDEELQIIKAVSDASKAYDAAMRFISYRARSSREVAGYLKKKGYAESLSGQVLERLRQVGLVSDRDFGAAWVADRMALKPRSRTHLKAELYQKGLSSDDIETALSGLSADDYQAMLIGVINKKRRESRYKDDTKLIAYLGRQGYSYDDIRSALAAAGT